MDLPQDPMMLFSVINMKLRDFYPSLDALCEDLNVDKEELVQSWLLSVSSIAKSIISFGEKGLTPLLCHSERSEESGRHKCM